MAKNLVAGETTKITESGSNISVELNDTMKNKINSIPNISIGTTTTGEAGTDASVSNSGTSTNMVLNFTIPKGANGQDGQDGADGTNGADGEDGITPHIGENGNWFLGEEDTGKPSRGIQGETGEQGQPGQPGSDGEDGQDGIGFTTASAGTPTQSDGYTVTPITFNKTDGSNVVVNVSAKNGLDGSGGTGGTTDYSELENKPKINNIELSGNRTLAELGIQPEGDYLESESDPTVPSHVKNITQQNINDWNNKSEFSGSYNDLSDKPTIPEEYSLPIASSTVLGGIKVGANLEITSDGTLNAQASGGTGGTTDYTQLSNKPKINNVELNGNKTLSELGVQQTYIGKTEPTDDSVKVWINPNGSNEEWSLIETFEADGINGVFEKTNINLKKAIVSIDAKIGTASKTMYLRIKTGNDIDYLRCGYISGVVNTQKEYITTVEIETQPFVIITARTCSKADTSSFNIINVSLPNNFEKKGNIKAISIGHSSEEFVPPAGTIINIYGVEGE